MAPLPLLVAIDTKGDIRPHLTHPTEPGKTLCGVRPHLTQPTSDSDVLCCRRCERIAEAR